MSPAEAKALGAGILRSLAQLPEQRTAPIRRVRPARLVISHDRKIIRLRNLEAAAGSISRSNPSSRRMDPVPAARSS